MNEPPPLDEQADTFAADMTGVLLAAVADDVHMVSSRANLDETIFAVGNRLELPESQEPSEIAKMRGARIPVPGLQGVEIAASWVFTPSSNGNWLKAWSSSFGLWVDGAPLVRLEVDHLKTSWLQAHIHVTGESLLLGYLLGTQGKKRRRLQQLHLPVGGFLFRPGIEDFLEFAIDEELIPGKEGWRDALAATREEFLRKQFMAMVGRHPEWAREGLEYAERRTESQTAGEE